MGNGRAHGKGMWTIGRYRQVPLSLHWTLPVALLVFGGLSPAAWLAVLCLIFAHEAGHAALLRQRGGRPTSVVLHGLGGECAYGEGLSLPDRMTIAWGGVIAQGAVWVAAQLLIMTLGEPSAGWLIDVSAVATGANLWMIALNLLPLRGMDGELAWLILPAYRRRRLGASSAGSRRAGLDRHRVQMLRQVQREIDRIVQAHNDAAPEMELRGEEDDAAP